MSEREDHESGEELSPDEFAHLFRPDDLPVDPPAQSTPASPRSDPFEDDWEPLVAIPVAGQPEQASGFPAPDPPLPPPAQEPADSDDYDEDGDEQDNDADEGADPADQDDQREESLEPIVATAPDPKEGRLFRSRGAPEVPDTITAVSAMQARRLSTLSRSRDAGDEPPAPELALPQADAWPAPLPVAASGEPAPALQVMSSPATPQSAEPQRGERKGRAADGRPQRRDRDERGKPTGGTLTALGVYAVTIGVTVILAFGETLFFGGEPGVITGIGLLAVSVFAAFAVRTADSINAVFAPPIAFFIAAATAGQMDINANDTSGRFVALFFLLGGNWVWIVGATVAALVIVALRRRIS